MSKEYESEEGEITHEDDIESGQPNTRIKLDAATRERHIIQNWSVSNIEQTTGINHGDVEEGEVLTDDNDANNSDVCQTQKYGSTPITDSKGQTLLSESRRANRSCFSISHNDPNSKKPIQKCSDDISQERFSLTYVHGNQQKRKRVNSNQSDRKRIRSQAFEDNENLYNPLNATLDLCEDNFTYKQCRKSSRLEVNTKLNDTDSLIRNKTPISSSSIRDPKRSQYDKHTPNEITSSLKKDSLPDRRRSHESFPPRDDKCASDSPLMLDCIRPRNIQHVFDYRRSGESAQEQADKEHCTANTKSKYTSEKPRYNMCTPGDSRFPGSRDVHVDGQAVKSKQSLYNKISHTGNSNSRKRNREDSAIEESYNGKRNRPNLNTRGRRTQHQGPIQYSSGFKSQMSRIRNPAYFLKTDLEVLTKKGSNEIVMVIATSDASLRRFIYEATTTENAYEVLIKLLRKALSCMLMPTYVMKIKRYLEKKDILRKLIEQIEHSLNKVITASPNQTESLKSIIEIANRIFEQTPSLVVYIAATASQIETLINTNIMVDETEVKEMFSDLCRNVAECLERKRAKSKCQGKKTDEDVDNDVVKFREITIFPQQKDILKATQPKLQPNKAKGSYGNLDHYLDTQFRLLREDFIGPLREGIQYVRQCGDTSKLQDIRLYEGVKILLPVCVHGFSHEVSFETKKLKLLWGISQRLIFGSLVCLSSDNFITCYFATVIDSKLRSKGRVTLKFNNDFKTINSLMGKRFVMAESVAYFEAFKHVLQSLQNIKAGQMPFENYIVKCKTTVLPPKYLRDKPGTVFDLRPLLEEDTVLFESSYFKKPGSLEQPYGYTNFTESSDHLKRVNILNKDWPKEDLLQLDKSQLQAVKTALTKEFSIIQGPPGCGKTYIGMKIVKVLLNNSHIWAGRKPDCGNPLVVLCYTNHALDQFMEGINSFYKGDILRVGNRSSSEVMIKCSLTNIRDRFREAKAIPQLIFDSKNSARRMFNIKKKHLYYITEQMKILKENIIHEKELTDEMGLYYKQFARHQPSSNQACRYLFLGRSVMVLWLGIPKMIRKIQDDIYRQGTSYISDKPILDEDVIHRDKRDDKDNNTFKQDADFQERMQTFKEKSVAVDIDLISSRPTHMNDEKWNTVRWERLELKETLNTLLKKTANVSYENENIDIFNEHFSLDQRWCLYNYWVNSRCQKQMADQAEMFDGLNQDYAQSTEALAAEDKYIMESADVIGLTTTGAARNQAILKEIQPKIVIVEEAAVVFESHIVSNLTSSCEQLILIGDHKQLRPKPTFYKLEKYYNLGISLFERMIRNGFEYNCLETQHRMRPVIADNVRSIYPSLTDNENVQQYENIKGVGHNLYFINHGEAELNDFETKGKSNEHEASFLTSLCHYFLQQGYKAEELTVITTYKKQMQDLRRIMKKKPTQFDLPSVKVTVVDSYQGEENDIILLSLVRSNKNDLVGFLKDNNRVCVALSRAKKGLYVIANFDMLLKTTKLWKDIISGVQQKRLFGPALPLKCQNHMDDPGIMASTADDFLKAPEGGCRKKCDTPLDCGHVCERYCHVIDREHKDTTCHKPCTKLCRNGHTCRKKCFEECECFQWIVTSMPGCGHVEDVLCSAVPSRYQCQREMDQLMSQCGHMISYMCKGRLVISDCTMKCEQIMDCGHPCMKTCSSNSRSIHDIYTLNMSKCPIGHVSICTLKCTTPLACGHLCSGNCENCVQSRIHRPCDIKCKYELLCGHECFGTCSGCEMCKERCERRCSHSQTCPNVCSQVCKPCTKPCEYICEHFICTKKCFEPCDRPRCNKRCRKRNSWCGHQCVGLCGDLCPMICPKCNGDVKYFGNKQFNDTCLVQLDDCGHFIQYDIMDQYMDKDEGVCLKRCPVCNKPIRESLRYKNVINATLQQIECEKIKVIKQKRTENNIFSETIEQLFSFKFETFTGKENITISTFFPRIPSKQFMLDIGREVCRLVDFLSIADAFDILERTKAYTKTSKSDLKDTLMSSKISLQEHNVYDADKRNEVRTAIRKVFQDLKSTYFFERVTVCLKVLDEFNWEEDGSCDLAEYIDQLELSDAIKENTGESASILIDFNETQHSKILPDEMIIYQTLDEKLHEKRTGVDIVNTQLKYSEINKTQEALKKQKVTCTSTTALQNVYKTENRNDMQPYENQMKCISNSEIISIDSPVHQAQEIQEQIVEGIINLNSQFDGKINVSEDVKQTENTEEADSVFARDLTENIFNKDYVDESCNINSYTTSNNIDNPVHLTDHTKDEENNEKVLSDTVFSCANIAMAMATAHETKNNEQTQMLSSHIVNSSIDLPKVLNGESKNQEQNVATGTVSSDSDILIVSTENSNVQEQNEMMPPCTINCCIGTPLTLKGDIENQKQNESIPPSTINCGNNVTMASIDDSKNEEQNESNLSNIVNSCKYILTMDSTDDIKPQEQHQNVASISVNSCIGTSKAFTDDTYMQIQNQTVKNINTGSCLTVPIYLTEESDNETDSSDNTVCQDENENENDINVSSSGAISICSDDNQDNNKTNNGFNTTNCIDFQAESPGNVNQNIEIKVDDAVNFNDQTSTTATEDTEDNETMDISDVLKTHDLQINLYKLSGRPYFKCAMSSFKACVIESQDSSICDSGPSEVPQATSNHMDVHEASRPHKFELKIRKFSDKFEVPTAIQTRQHRDVEKQRDYHKHGDRKEDNRDVKISNDKHNISQSYNEEKDNRGKTFGQKSTINRHHDNGHKRSYAEHKQSNIQKDNGKLKITDSKMDSRDVKISKDKRKISQRKTEEKGDRGRTFKQDRTSNSNHENRHKRTSTEHKQSNRKKEKSSLKITERKTIVETSKFQKINPIFHRVRMKRKVTEAKPLSMNTQVTVTMTTDINELPLNINSQLGKKTVIL